MARSKCSNQRPDTLMQDRSPPARRKSLATHGRTIHVGQSRPNWAVRAMSGSPPVATGLRSSRIGSIVPGTDSCTAASSVSSITSSARACSTGPPAPGFSVLRVDTDQSLAAHWAHVLRRRLHRRGPADLDRPGDTACLRTSRPRQAKQEIVCSSRSAHRQTRR
jgi:hypothetical protein